MPMAQAGVAEVEMPPHPSVLMVCQWNYMAKGTDDGIGTS
jgi:hypothetical protein